MWASVPRLVPETCSLTILHDRDVHVCAMANRRVNRNRMVMTRPRVSISSSTPALVLVFFRALANGPEHQKNVY